MSTKLKIKHFPDMDCLAVFTVHKGCGPAGHKNGNPAVGWGVHTRGHTISPVFKNVKLAKAWAEERYDIAGWTEDKGDVYHQMYAMPSEPEGS